MLNNKSVLPLRYKYAVSKKKRKENTFISTLLSSDDDGMLCGRGSLCKLIRSKHLPIKLACFYVPRIYIYSKAKGWRGIIPEKKKKNY